MKAHVGLYEFVGTAGLVTAAVPPKRKYQVHEETTSWLQDFISTNPRLAKGFPLGALLQVK